MKYVGEVKAGTANIVKVPEVLGVQMIGNSELKIRVIAECKPNTQGEVGRILNAEIKKHLDASGIEIPYPKVVTYIKQEKVEAELRWRRSNTNLAISCR